MSMSEAFSVPFHTLIKLCYTKALEWSSLVPGPEPKSSSEVINPTSFTISILKSRDIILPTKVHLVKAMVFPVVLYGCESRTVKYMGICKQLQITSLYFFIPISRGLNLITACVCGRFQVATPKDTKSWSTEHWLEITRHGHRGMLLNTWSPHSAIRTVFWASLYGPHFNFDSLWWTMSDSWSP